MRKISLATAAALSLAAACSSEPEPTSSHASPSTMAFAFDDAATSLLPPARAALYGELASRSAIVPALVVEVGSVAVTRLGFDHPPLAATPLESAWRFVERYQPLLDDRVAWTEYTAVASPEGCDGTVIMFDRFIAGTQVIGSRLTLHFDDRGHLVHVTNGVAPVLGVIRSVDPTKLPGARPLGDVVGKVQGGLPRVPVLAPLPDGSGVHAADLVSFFDDRGKLAATLAIKDTAITGVLDETRDDHPRPRISPSVYIAAGDTVPSFVSYATAGGQPINGLPIERNPIERAYRYLETHATVFHTGEARCQFVPRAMRESPDGDVHVRLGQQHGTLPVFGAELVITLDGDRVQSVLGHTIDALDLSLTPARSAAEAIGRTDAALAAGTLASPEWQKMVDRSQGEPAVTRLGVLPRWAVRAGGSVNGKVDRLAWEVRRGAFTFYVDAQDGQIRNAASGIEAAAVVTDGLARNEFLVLTYATESIDGVHVAGAPLNFDTAPGRAGGNTATSLVAVQSTYRALGWNGQDGRGSSFVAHTNTNPLTVPCRNAFFDSTFTQAAFFCLGIGTNDVVAHEMTHGVISSSSRLAYQDESGAINEAFADVMGNTIFREPGGGWLVGENDPAGALRNMAAPAHMSTYRHRDSTCDVFPWSCDHGFVHTNSAIINKAHQLLADGVPGPTPGTPVTPGIGRDKLMMLAFTTMTTRLPANARMNDVPLAERDVCERFVARGTRDLTGAPFLASDCNQIGTAFMQVGLAPGLTASWSEPALGFAGSRTYFPSSLDVTPSRCPVLNIEANLVQLSGAQTVDLSPSTATPPTVSWLGLSRLTMRVPAGTPPFPIGTPFKRHTVDWFAIYGVTPSFYTNVIPDPACPPVVEQSAVSGTFDEAFLFGNGNSSPATTRLGNTASSIDSRCTLGRVELELLDDAGSPIGEVGATATHDIVHWFLFIPVHFGETATTLTPPSLIAGSPGPHDLSGTIRYSYAFGRRFHVRWRYYFTAPSGVTCTP